MKTIIEPFKIKIVEPIKLTTPAERETILRRAHFNVFQIRFPGRWENHCGLCKDW